MSVCHTCNMASCVKSNYERIVSICVVVLRVLNNWCVVILCIGGSLV